MAISINWSTQVIYVPKADMTLIQASPEVRELNLNSFRLTLKSLEDDAEGMGFLRTHNHNTEVALAGLIYARTVEIINGYTVEFEDGQYTVNCVGANHNLSDVKVANQVSLIVNNAAGLISNAAIEYSSFNGGVSVNPLSAYSGTVFPIGTPQAPVNNLADALLIAQVRGFTSMYVTGDILIDSGGDYTNLSFIGESQTKSSIEVSDAANVVGCEFYNSTILGTLDGNSLIQDCALSNLEYVWGVIQQCILNEGTIVLGGSQPAILLDCWSGAPTGDYPTIDCGGSGQDLAIQNYSGRLKLINKTGTDSVDITMNGSLVLDSTITNGTLSILGVGDITDNSTGSAAVHADLLSAHAITDQVWDESIADHLLTGSTGDALDTASSGGVDYAALATAVWDELIVSHVTADSFADVLKKILKLTGNKVTKSGNIITIYEDNGTTVWRQYDLTDGGRVVV